MLKVGVIFLFIIQMLNAANLFSQNDAINRTQSLFRYALLTSQANVDFAFYRENYIPTKLTKEQVLIVLSIIKRVSDSLHFLITSTNVNTKKVDTLKHVFQIVSAKNNQGQIYLFVNAICDPDKDWRSRLIFVDGGGNCYYTFRFNVKSKQYFDIKINTNG